MTKAEAEAIVIKCLDPRVQRSIRLFLEQRGLPEGTWAPQSPPGASLDIETVFSSIDLAVKHLGTKQILVFDHQDCLAFSLENREFDFEHAKSLWDAQELLTARYPTAKIRTFLMVSQEGDWDIQET